MKIFLRISTVFLLILVMISCGTGTKVTGSWTKIDLQPESFKKVVVLGIAQNSVNRRIFEDQVETRLQNMGYPVVAALDYLPPNAAIGTITKEIVGDIFKSAGVDAIFTMSLRHEEDTRHYVPASGAYYSPYYAGYGFYDYYGGFGSYYYSPGYYTGSVKVYLEANLFDFESGDLLWSAQTTTTNVSDVNKMAVQFADIIVADFVRQNVLVKPTPPPKKK